MWRIGIIGAGWAGRCHAEALSHLDGVRIVGWVSANASRALEAAGQFGGQAMGLQQLCESQQLDLILVCSPTHLHSEHLSLALSAGTRVFCEKPLVRTRKQLQKLAAVPASRVYVGHVLRHFPAYAKVREANRSGSLGSDLSLECTRLNTPQRGWFNDVANSGGVLLDLGLHDLDWLIWTLGRPSESRVIDHAFTFARVELNWANARARLTCSWQAERFSQSLLAKGPLGAISLAESGEMTQSYSDSEPQKVELPPQDPYQAQMRDVLRWLDSGIEPVCSLAEAADSVSIALDLIGESL